MNILLVVPWDQEFGGVASVVGNLATYLKDRGHAVFFFHPGHNNRLQQKITKWGFQGYQLNLREPVGFRQRLRGAVTFTCLLPITLFQLLRLIRIHKIQVINIHYPADGFFYFALCRRLVSLRLVLSIHGADFFPGGRPPSQDHSRPMQYLLSASDFVVAPSRAFLRDFLQLVPGLEERATAIHNGVNTAEIITGAARQSWPALRNYILCIAHQNEKKGLDVLIEAFAQVKSVDPSLSLVLVGDGPLRGELEGLAARLEVSDRTLFLGWRNRTEIAALLHDCTIFVLPSRSEPFGIVIIEAMASGKPVVASSVGGIPEIIEHGKNGIMVEPENPVALAVALKLLLEHPELRRSFGEQGVETVHRRFTREVMGGAYESLFARLLKTA